MKVIRRVSATIGVLFVGLVVVSLLLPSSYRVESSALIEAPADVVFQQVADFQHWKAWNVWDQGNTNAVTSDPSHGINAWREWKNGPEGYAKATSTYQEESSGFFYRLLFGDHGVLAVGVFDFQPAEGKATKVHWTIADKVGIDPLKRWFALSYSLRAGRELDGGLANLKKICEREGTVN